MTDAAALDRVQNNTSDAVNRMIHEEMLERLVYYALNPARIADRLAGLDREWEVERALEANASTFAPAGLDLGLMGSRRWFAPPVAVAGFLLQHAIHGWRPPLPLLRRLGFRTSHEIDQGALCAEIPARRFPEGGAGHGSAAGDAARAQGLAPRAANA